MQHLTHESMNRDSLSANDLLPSANPNHQNAHNHRHHTSKPQQLSFSMAPVPLILCCITWLPRLDVTVGHPNPCSTSATSRSFRPRAMRIGIVGIPRDQGNQRHYMALSLAFGFLKPNLLATHLDGKQSSLIICSLESFSAKIV